MEKIPRLDIDLDIENPICIPRNNNAFQARRALKPAKVTKTCAVLLPPTANSGLFAVHAPEAQQHMGAPYH